MRKLYRRIYLFFKYIYQFGIDDTIANIWEAACIVQILQDFEYPLTIVELTE